MATAIDFEGTNRRFTAPAGEEDRVNELRAFSNKTVNVTKWQLTAEEYAEVVRTGCIWVSVLSGDTFFPMFVSHAEGVRELALDFGGGFPRQDAPAERAYVDQKRSILPEIGSA